MQRGVGSRTHWILGAAVVVSFTLVLWTIPIARGVWKGTAVYEPCDALLQDKYDDPSLFADRSAVYLSWWYWPHWVCVGPNGERASLY